MREPLPTNDRDIEAALKLLEGNENFRVLRRLPEAELINDPIKDATVGVVVDVETTGLDIEVDEVIELGMIKFLFDKEGRVGRVLQRYRSLNKPSIPIPRFITDLTGIRESDVENHTISPREIEAFVSDANLVIAHNAAFDRPFCERLFPGFSELSWACSATEIDWSSEGISGSRLEYIAFSFGRFYEAHRAIDDCNALLQILSFTLPRSGKLVLTTLLENARRTEVRLFAESALYDLRGALKRKGYRWNDGQNGYPRAWWKDVPTSELTAELATLAGLDKAVSKNTKQFRMTAKNRFRRKA